MPAILVMLIGLVIAFFGVYGKKKSNKPRLSIAFICVGVFLIVTGALLFYLVAADIIVFPLF